MQPDVVQKLLQVNQTFYDSFADSFSHTRKMINNGFDDLLTAVPEGAKSLLDVACGNGRFGKYLFEHDAIQSYTGVDFSAELLKIAREITGGAVYQRDLTQPDALDGLGQFDIVACLAALHHIPGEDLKVRLLKNMKARLSENGRIFLSMWEFMDSERQQRKVRDWSEIGLSPEDVGPNDYLLTWQTGGFSYRYACMIDEAETAVLAEKAGLKIIKQFRSDGREGNLSLYAVLEKLD
mgnify:CR=1 FL=1